MKKRNTRTRGFGWKIGLMVGPFLPTFAWADEAGGSVSGGMSPLMIGFLVLVGIVVLMQLVPAMVILGSLVSAVFKRSKKTVETSSVKERA